jgi:hypothetical protein
MCCIAFAVKAFCASRNSATRQKPPITHRPTNPPQRKPAASSTLQCCQISAPDLTWRRCQELEVNQQLLHAMHDAQHLQTNTPTTMQTLVMLQF